MILNAINNKNIQATQQIAHEHSQCPCCKTPPTKQDVLELQSKQNKPNFWQKTKTACQKTGSFINENKTIIRSSIKGCGIGLMNACTILGAGQIVNKMTKADTSKFAATLAIITGVAVAASTALRESAQHKKTEKEIIKPQ